MRTTEQFDQSLPILASDFEELRPPLTDAEARTEAARCLQCHDAPCTRACPTRIDVPRFIRRILHRDPRGAAKTILDANILGDSCARVCPTEVLCEGACVENTRVGRPILIGRLQRHACDAAGEATADFHAPGRATGYRVAIVGGGPAGLASAHELRKRGHAVTLFEAADRAGGLNAFGVAPYKLRAEIVAAEVERVRRIGVEIRTDYRIDPARFEQLRNHHDAVLLAIGLGPTVSLGIPGEQTSGVREALEFIAQARTLPRRGCSVGKNVLVIGGGNTALDVANIARGLGAERVVIAYRRDEASMPAFAHEIALARVHGVEFLWQCVPQRVLAADGAVRAVELQHVRRGQNGTRGDLKPAAAPAFTHECDMLVIALGQQAWHELIRALPGLDLAPDGRITTDTHTGATSLPGVFAAGDCRHGVQNEVVYAVEDGKLAAAGIDAHLRSRACTTTPHTPACEASNTP